MDLNNFSREVFVNHLASNNEKLGGICIIVGIDESNFSNRKFNLGSRVDDNQVGVVGAIV